MKKQAEKAERSAAPVEASEPLPAPVSRPQKSSGGDAAEGEKPPHGVRCQKCGKEQQIKKRLPQGWKRKGEEYWCGACWTAKYILRAVSMPVASPLDCSWEELRKMVKAQWADTTACSNWMTTELYARDIRRNGHESKMPAMEHVYLYPEARLKFPNLPAQSVASIEHAIQRKYRAKRYETIWTAAASLPNHRYPTPFPVHNQSWHASIEADKPIVSVRIGDARMRLRLKSGKQFRRQLGQFRLIARGEAVSGELAIYQRGDAMMCKMVAWLPRQKPAAADGTLNVRTAKDCLLLAVNAKDETLWRYNGDHLRRWIAEHRRQLQRWSEDAKYENRPVPSFAERRQHAAQKFRHRMDSATHEIAAQLVGYAKRRRFAKLTFDDSDQSYCEQFPWFRLRSLIEEKADAAGIQFEVIVKAASAEAKKESPEPLAEDINE